jgi:hypothetical protein
MPTLHASIGSFVFNAWDFFPAKCLDRHAEIFGRLCLVKVYGF